MDCASDPTCWSRALIVDEGGGVWLWTEVKEEIRERLNKTMTLYVTSRAVGTDIRRKVRNSVQQEREGFFRIAFGSRSGTATVMSDREITVIDFEVRVSI